MAKRIAIYGASEETLALVPLLEANPEVEIPVIFDPDLAAARARLGAFPPEVAARIAARLTDDVDRLVGCASLHAVVDAGGAPALAERAPDLAAGGVQLVAPLTARLLWGHGAAGRDHKSELLQALHEVVESYDLSVDTHELFGRMLEIAIGVTGADRGSLMLLDPERRELRVRVAVGIEPELWPKIRLRLGEGIAGRAAQDARPLRIRGRADRGSFRLVRERLDVESALCVPLVHAGAVLGVLNLHHTTRPDAFRDEDLDFVQQLAALDAQIIARAQEHETLRDQAARYAAVREARAALAAHAPLADRLAALCAQVARRLGRGIATVYLHDPDPDELRLAATSLAGGGLGGEYRIALGEGVDGRAAAEREPVFLDGPGDALAYAALPLLADGRLVGLLAAQAGPDAPRGHGAREGLLEIAAAAADAIAQAEREARMQTRATKVGAINEMGIRLLGGTDVAEVARMATSSGAMILDADHAVLRLQDEETGRFVIRSYYGSASGRDQERLFRLDKAVSVDVIKRRSPALVRDPARSLPGVDAPVRSWVAAPLRREGRVVGTLAFYDKLAADAFYPGAFHDDDFEIFNRFVGYVERAVANAALHAQARMQRSFDDDTGLPNATYLARRLDEEIARAGEQPGRLAVAVCRIHNWRELAEASDPAHQRRVLQRTAEALRGALRGFDVPARTGDAQFAVLLPDPGDDPAETVSALARKVADAVASDDALQEPERVALVFGWAVHPEEGRDRDSLLAAAATARIRML
jgi:diguanylate cyclase (GGDEF)-like protein